MNGLFGTYNSQAENEISIETLNSRTDGKAAVQWK